MKMNILRSAAYLGNNIYLIVDVLSAERTQGKERELRGRNPCCLETFSGHENAFSVHENAFSIIKKTFSGHYPQGFFVIAAPHPPNPINLNQSTGDLCLDK